MNLEWSDEKFSVKVDEIDEQHKKLFSFINRLDNLIKSDRSREELAVILNEMNEYAQYHFSTEEKYFDKFDYPESDEHKARHHQYEVKIAEYKERLGNLENADLIDFMYEVLDFLQDWWIGHILHEDMKYSKFFNDHGLK